MIYLFILLSMAAIFGRFVNFYFSSKMHKFSVDRMDWGWVLTNQKFHAGLVEELALSLAISALFPVLPFLAFGWLYSTFQDGLMAVFYPEKRSLRNFHENQCFRSLIRDFFVPYLVFGVAFSLLNLDIYMTGMVFLGLNMALLAKQITAYY